MRFKLLIAVLAAVVVSFVAVGAATATLPLTQSQPAQAVCEAQGGTFNAPVPSTFSCTKVATGDQTFAFTPTQLAVQRTLCERVYGASFFFFNVFEPTETFAICQIL